MFSVKQTIESKTVELSLKQKQQLDQYQNQKNQDKKPQNKKN